MTGALILTDDERAMILALREIDSRPDSPDLIKLRERRMVWFSLIEARATMYRDALRHGMNDMAERQRRMLALVTPFDLMELVQAWRHLQKRISDDEEREMLEAAGAEEE